MLAQISTSLKWVSLAWFIRGDASQPYKRSLQEDCLVQNHEALCQSGQYLARLVRVCFYGSFHTRCSLKQHFRIAIDHLSRRLDKPVIFSIFDLSWTSEILIIWLSEVIGFFVGLGFKEWRLILGLLLDQLKSHRLSVKCRFNPVIQWHPSVNGFVQIKGKPNSRACKEANIE